MEIEHDSVGKRFYIELGGEKAVLSYTEKDNVWGIHEVIVPEGFRGQGIAEKLTLHVFELAREKGYKIIPTCPYVKDKFLKKYRECQSLCIRY